MTDTPQVRDWRVYYRTPDGREHHGDLLTREVAEAWVEYGNRVWPALIHWAAQEALSWQEVDPLRVQPYYEGGELVAVRVRED